MRVLVVGAGAREHAISSAYEKSPQVRSIVVAPGNDFIAYRRQKEVAIDKRCSLKDPASILEVARRHNPDLVDVAQDDALAAGTVDLLQENGFSVFGPTKNAAQIEWDKNWSREFMDRYRIPCPLFSSFGSEQKAKDYVKDLYAVEHDRLLYVKAAGLCGGKGALRATKLDEALERIERMKEFGDSGKVFLIEDGLIGEEFSCYAISDGKTYRLFKSAQDNKTAYNFDEGDNTGGMGAVSPAMVTEPVDRNIEKELVAKAIRGMREEGRSYKGILYVGGMEVNRKPFVIEYNARWGDPECQVVLPGVETDYLDIVTAVLTDRLGQLGIEQDGKTRVCVVGASRGYPNDHSQAIGKRIYGLEDAMELDDVTIYSSAIAVADGRFYANGGRLFSVVAEGGNIIEARQRAYAAIAYITIEGNNLHYRTDIGWRDVERFLKGV